MSTNDSSNQAEPNVLSGPKSTSKQDDVDELRARKNLVYSLVVGSLLLLDIVGPVVITYLAPAVWRRSRWQNPSPAEILDRQFAYFYEPCLFAFVGALIAQEILLWFFAIGTSNRTPAKCILVFWVIAIFLSCTWIGECFAASQVRFPSLLSAGVVFGVSLILGFVAWLLFKLNNEELFNYSRDAEIPRKMPRISIGFLLLLLTSCGMIIALAKQDDFANLHESAELEIIYDSLEVRSRIARLSYLQIEMFWLLMLQQAAITAGLAYAMMQLILRNQANWVGGLSIFAIFSSLVCALLSGANSAAIQSYAFVLLGIASITAFVFVPLRTIGWRLEQLESPNAITLDSETAFSD